MSLFTNFCRNMSKRSYQYMVRSTYAVLPSVREKRDSYSYNSPNQSKRVKKVREGVVYNPLDKNGVPCKPYYMCKYNGEEKKIVRTTPKMVVFADGTKRKASNVEMLGW